MAVRLSIVIPSHSRADLLSACLASVCRHCPPSTEVLVVDDASPGSVVSQAARRFAGVRCVRLERRGGFCRAANTGIAAASGDVVEMLNDDTEVCPGWAEAALGCFEDEKVVAVAPLVLAWPGGEVGQARIDSAGDGYFVGGIAWKRWHGQTLSERHLCPGEVFGASASSAFYRRSALLAGGGFCEDFGAYFEDVDLSFRLRAGGGRIVYEPRSRVLHHISASHGRCPPADLLRQQSRNEERVYWRNLPPWKRAVAMPLHLTVLMGKCLRRWHQGQFEPFLRGRLDAWQERWTGVVSLGRQGQSELESGGV